MDKLAEILKEFSENIEKRFSVLEKRIEATATENADLRERLIDLERATGNFPDEYSEDDE